MRHVFKSDALIDLNSVRKSRHDSNNNIIIDDICQADKSDDIPDRHKSLVLNIAGHMAQKRYDHIDDQERQDCKLHCRPDADESAQAAVVQDLQIVIPDPEPAAQIVQQKADAQLASASQDRAEQDHEPGLSAQTIKQQEKYKQTKKAQTRWEKYKTG